MSIVAGERVCVENLLPFIIVTSSGQYVSFVIVTSNGLTIFPSAPEILQTESRKAGAYDQSCDAWSLGVILYILYGR
jgi:hypothetical protein